jgi:hypothetical protein
MLTLSSPHLLRGLVLLTALAVSPIFSACNKPRKVLLNKRQLKKIDSAVTDSAPKTQKAVNVQFDDRVRLVGVTLNKKKVKPGGAFTIKYVWEVTGAVNTTDWKIFVHVDGNGKRFGADHHGVGGLFPMRKWPKGKFVTYEQSVKIPKDAKAANAGIWIGVFDELAHKAGRKERMQVTNDRKKLKLRMDGDGRIEIANIEIIGKKGASANVSAPQYAISRSAKPIVIDGVLDEPAWKSARNTRAFMSGQGRPLPGRNATLAKMTWDADYFYAGFIAKDPDIFSEFKGRDSTLWKQDCIEIYLDPGVTHTDYVELQISPTGEIFDAHFDSRRKPEWKKAASRLTLSGMKTGLTLQGSANNSKDGVSDRQWTLEVAIPWTDLPSVTGPPKDGEAWGVNFYRVDVRSGGKGKIHGHWSPAGNDFHNTNRFATVRFSNKTGRVGTLPRGPHGKRLPGKASGGKTNSKTPVVPPVPAAPLLRRGVAPTGQPGRVRAPVKVIPSRVMPKLAPTKTKIQ